MAEPTTRENILIAARDLFFARGLDATSMRDIATRVGLAQSSLYNHFATKDHLVLAVMERSFHLVDGAIAEVFGAEPPSLELLRAVLRAHTLQHVYGSRETTLFEAEGRHMAPMVSGRVRELRGFYEHRFYDLAEQLAGCGLLMVPDLTTRVRFLLSAGVRIGGWFNPAGPMTAEEIADVYATWALNSLGVFES
ncbi:MAG: TetR/AcrR family transcriptional regulator [Chloroflexi bacterium]|nr:TetR/AcrR family transcriptional regulator [Chloroflexota bacterium]